MKAFLLLCLVIKILTPMEALDIVKEKYASDFAKTFIGEDSNDYYYKADDFDYYLVYEETDEFTGHYLIRLYEFVVDEPDTGIGHAVTYGFYWVDPLTGKTEAWDFTLHMEE